MTFFELMEKEYQFMVDQGKWVNNMGWLAEQVADDILGRFGSIEEAQKYIYNMPFLVYTVMDYEVDFDTVQIAIDVKKAEKER